MWPGIAHAHPDAGQQLERRVVGNDFQLAQHGVDILELEQRRHALRTRRQVPVRALGFAQREIRGIAQQYGQEIGAGRVGVDRPPESARHQQRQTTAMVDVRMAEHHGIDGGGLEREGAPVAGRGVRTALDHSAVQQ